MKWKDLFYFSHGERRALIVVLILLTGTWMVLNFSSVKQTNNTADNKLTDTIRGTSSQEKAVQKKLNPTYASQNKFAPGTIVELNSADTTLLKKVPGIGSAFSNRIIKYRNLVGGFYSVNQLNEVYGIDEERFRNLEKWFTIDPLLIQKINIQTSTEEELKKHPYISYQQAKAIINLRKEKKTMTWEQLLSLKEFTENDLRKLKPYIQNN